MCVVCESFYRFVLNLCRLRWVAFILLSLSEKITAVSMFQNNLKDHLLLKSKMELFSESSNFKINLISFVELASHEQIRPDDILSVAKSIHSNAELVHWTITPDHRLTSSDKISSTPPTFKSLCSSLPQVSCTQCLGQRRCFIGGGPAKITVS